VSLVRVEGLSKAFHRANGEPVHAVNDVSFAIGEGETLALIGESGSGKSTIGRLLLRLIEPDAGTIEIDGQDVRSLGREPLRRMRSTMQVVFQEPYESLNPRMRVGDIIAEPLAIHEPQLSRAERQERVFETMREVGLESSFADRLPRAMSGGQQQRVGIARAIVTRPKLLVLDEPTSSLDLSVQAQILKLLHRLQEQLGMSYLYISHDLSTVNYVAHRVAVLYLGQVREMGPVARVVDDPQDPYTRALLSAYLSPDPQVGRDYEFALRGEIPSPTSLPAGCFLYGRCPIRLDRCAVPPVPLRGIDPGHVVRCVRAPLSEPMPVHEVAR
jgi:peptide/nickel transport system ATP-binding protein/oligopeptide transport system ATP-binding protein